MQVLWPDFAKRNGLLPVVAVSRQTKKVLMVAYANEEAYMLTLTTGFAHYYSTSRNELWRKGETSGFVQQVSEVLIDCDGDALIYVVDQTGPACHTGTLSCFSRSAIRGSLEPSPLKRVEPLTTRDVEVAPQFLPPVRLDASPASVAPPGGTYARRGFGM